MTKPKPIVHRSVKVPPPTALPDLALGAWEAAAVCGVHFTRIKRMAAAGQLIYRPMDSAWTLEESGEPVNEFLLYSLHDCDDNYRAYIEKLPSGGTGRRPRNEDCLARHGEMLKKLKDVEPIVYDDAISTAQAAAILGVHVTWVNSMIRDGRIKARQALSERRGSLDGKGRVYIVSRRSVEANRAAVTASERAGTKRGKKRAKPTGAVKRVPRKK